MGFEVGTLALIKTLASVGAAIGTGYSAVQAKKQKDETKAAVQKQEAATAAELQKAKDAEGAALADATTKADERRRAIETSGRPSTFATAAFGLDMAAPVKKKKLGQ